MQVHCTPPNGISSLAGSIGHSGPAQWRHQQNDATTMQPLTPTIAIHLTAALAATAIGPLALWARLGRSTYPRLHRAAGYAWVTLMLITAVSALFIRNVHGLHLAGYTPLHLLVLVTLVSLGRGFWYLAQHNITGHRLTMQWTYIGACIVAGGFTLLPSRYLGQWLWGHLGLL